MRKVVFFLLYSVVALATLIGHFLIKHGGCRSEPEVKPAGLEKSAWLGDCEGSSNYYFGMKLKNGDFYMKVYDADGNKINSGFYSLIEDKVDLNDSTQLRNNILGYSPDGSFIVATSYNQLVKKK